MLGVDFLERVFRDHSSHKNTFQKIDTGQKTLKRESSFPKFRMFSVRCRFFGTRFCDRTTAVRSGGELIDLAEKKERGAKKREGQCDARWGRRTM